MTTQTTTQTAPSELLHGRVALITGGTRGIGAAICTGLSALGATVAAGYSQDRERADSFADTIRERGCAASVHQGNVGSAEDCRRTVQEVIDTHGRLDILVNNAGITIDKSALKMTDEDWYRVISVNLSGAFFMSQSVLPHMIGRGSGRIINISSIAGQIGNVGQANYAASKSGLFGLTKTLAREAAAALARGGKLDADSPGLTINTIAPGLIATEMVEHIPQPVMDKFIENIPVHRLGRPDEIARVVGFLCSDASAYITGQVWSINGGLDM